MVWRSEDVNNIETPKRQLHKPDTFTKANKPRLTRFSNNIPEKGGIDYMGMKWYQVPGTGQYMEVRGIQIDIKLPEDLENVKNLVEIKINN